MIVQGQRVRRGAEVANLRDQAYEGYTRSLLAREIAPGQFITQRELVEITGYPLGAIRELVPRLEAEHEDAEHGGERRRGGGEHPASAELFFVGAVVRQ